MVREDRDLEAMLRERTEMRSELVLIAKSQQYTVFAFATVLIGVGSVYWKDTLIADPRSRSLILFFLSQIEMLFMFQLISLTSSMVVHSRYVAALESRINALCGTDVSLWESRVTQACLCHPRGSSFWSVLCMALLGGMLLVFALAVTFQQNDSYVLGAILLVEIAAGVAMLIQLHFEPSRSARIIAAAFENEGEHESKVAEKSAEIAPKRAADCVTCHAQHRHVAKRRRWITCRSFRSKRLRWCAMFSFRPE
ncbi:MAG: hypothetical protein WC712_01870 [Candidatus Brocadiia bacterium]